MSFTSHPGRETFVGIITSPFKITLDVSLFSLLELLERDDAKITINVTPTTLKIVIFFITKHHIQNKVIT